MKSGFGEGTFQVNHLRQLCALYGAAVIGAIDEPPPGLERDLGFDAVLKISLGSHAAVPVFLQYKQQELITTKRDADCWGYYGGPHYRFGFRKDKKALRDPTLPLYRQHNLLVLLRMQRYIALYVAPRFHGKPELEELASSTRLLDASFYADPNAIGRVRDRDDHHVSYSTSASRWAFHSEFRAMGPQRAWNELVTPDDAQPVNTESLDAMAHQLRDLVESDFSEHGRLDEDESATPPVPDDVSLKVAWLAETLDAHFGAALVILPVVPWGMPEGSHRWFRSPWHR